MSAEYELVLMLDPEVADERRDEIASGARQRIESGASLKDERSWGMRKLAYEIRQRNEADYRFFRFEAESPLLNDLDHTLKITDGVLRFRIFKVDPESPVIEPPPPVSLASSAPARGPRDRRPPRGPEPTDEAPAVASAAADAEAETTPAEPEPGPSEPGPSEPGEAAEAIPEAAPDAEATADAEPAAQ